MAFVAERAIGDQSLLGHVTNLSGMTSYTYRLVRPSPVIVHISVAYTAFHVIDSMFRAEPLVVSRGSLFLVAIHTVLLAELDAMAIRRLARRQKRGLELLPLGVQNTCGRGLRTVRTVLVLASGRQ